MAKDLLTLRGESILALSPASRVTRALLTTSDFPIILGDTLGPVLRDAYQAAPSGSRKQRKLKGDMAATAAEAISGMHTVQALSIEDRAADISEGANRRSLKDGVKAKCLAAGLECMVDLLIALATALVLYFGALQVMRGRITPGDLILFITYLKATFRPIRSYAKYTTRLAKASAAGERVVELLDKVPDISDTKGAIAAPDFHGDVTFDRVSFGYRKDRPALDNLSLVIAPGQSVALTGPSGAGKSTLAGLLLRLFEPTRGQILIDGTDIRAFTLARLRGQIGLVPQETVLFRGTLAENIALGPGREVTADEIEAAARLANAHDFITALQEGYNTQVAERGATLSAGQRQRIAIARAALRHSPILIFDEPTTGLDGHNEAIVTDAIWRLARGRTSLLITHDLSQAARADRIIFLDGGHVAEEGDHATLNAQNGKYARL